MAAFPQPHHRNDFEVAIFCALGVESDAVEALFDEFWEDASYGKAAGDINTYTLGRIGSHNVVLAHMPGIGKASAANVASSFRSSFPAIKLGLVVGICGGVPYGADNKTEIVLGDVVISTGLVTYDFGRQFDHGFISKNTLESNLGRPNAEIRALLAKLGGRRGHLRLRENTYRHLTALFQDKGFENARYLGADEDQLFEPTYRHKHHDLALCAVCDKCVGTEDEVCAAALKSSCVELKCDENKQIIRSRLIWAKEVAAKVDWSHTVAQDDTDANRPFIHFGLMASGDAVMKSGKERDRIVAEKEVIAFEMEGAGVWDAFPCVVVKGVCDYADSHKNKKWQGYAASTAAACMKAFLQEWVISDKQSQSVLSPISFDKGTIKIEARAFESKELSEDTILELFRRWRNQDDLPSHNGVLWIKGKPGAGKSTLMKHTLLHCQENLGHLTIIAHFFNARGKQLEKTLIGMLRSIIYQLLETDSVLCERFAQNFVDKERKHGTDWEWSVGELQSFLLLEIKKARIKPLLLLIDALDECDVLEVQKVVKFLEDLSISAVSAKVLVYICLSSRHYPTIDMKNRLELKLEEQEQHDKDIIIYVRDKLRVPDKEISQNILERADHVFLWVVLVVEMLNQAFDCGKINAMKRKLQEVPSDLDGIFYILLQKDNPDIRATLLMYQWVLFAIRPLSPLELYFGVIAGTEPEELGAWEPQSQSLEVIERYITNISRGLIEVRKGIVAQFIHQSVNDFLLRNKRLQTLDHTLQQHMVGASHDRLVVCCMAYITTKELDLYVDEEYLEEMRIIRRGYRGFTEILAREFPFLRYAAKYVLAHAEMAQAESIPQLAFVQQLQHGDFQRLRTLRNTFVDYFSDHEKYTESLLCVVSLYGHIELVKIILQDPAASVKRDASYIGNALQVASFHGHYKIVELLLEMGAEVNQEGGEYGSALHAAIYNRHSQVAALLLEKGADFDLNVGRCGTALYAASSWNRVDAVVLLLEKGAEINVQGGEYGTALHAASYHGYEKIIVLLLEEGADINLGGGKYGAALHAASHLALKDTVALLLENGADVNLPDGNHGTALHAASTGGCKEVVLLLLEKGARVNLQAGRYSTALQIASYRGYEEIVALLLEKGADVNIQGGHFGNALRAALAERHDNIVTLLRNHGAIEYKSMKLET